MSLNLGDVRYRYATIQSTFIHSSRIRFFTFFFENPKNATFYVFLKRHIKKRKKRNPKFEVSDFVDSLLNEIFTTAQKQCMFIISSCVKGNKCD